MKCGVIYFPYLHRVFIAECFLECGSELGVKQQKVQKGTDFYSETAFVP